MLNLKISTANLDGVKELLRDAAGAAPELASATINEGIQYARKIGGEDILAQVNFPAHYLDLPERFVITQTATPTAPTARLTARRRATSLGTFVQSAGPRGRGVTVKTQRKGSAKKMSRAFVTNALKAGTAAGGNRGVAIRTKGEKPRGAHKPVELFRDDYGVVWLLYGPSVNQVFSDVAEAVIPRVNRFMENRLVQLYSARFRR